MSSTVIPHVTDVKLKKVLIVDDSAAIHQAYTISLAKYKCAVLTALSGPEGLNLLAGNPDVSLLIVDLFMPRMSGHEFIKKVKVQEVFHHIPVIAVVSKGQAEDPGDTLTGADGILTKPFTSTEIHSAVGRLFPHLVPAGKTD